MPTPQPKIKPLIGLLAYEYFRAVEFVEHHWPTKQWGAIVSQSKINGTIDTEKYQFIIVNVPDKMKSMVFLNYYCLPGLENHPELKWMIHFANERRFQGWIYESSKELATREQRSDSVMPKRDRKSDTSTSRTTKSR